MALNYTPNYIFDGSSYDNSYDLTSSDSWFTLYNITKVEVSSVSMFLHFDTVASRDAWGTADWTLNLSFPSLTKAYEGDHTVVHLSSNSTYSQWRLDTLTSEQRDDLAQTIVSAGAGTSVVTFTKMSPPSGTMSVFSSHLNLRSDASGSKSLDIDCTASGISITGSEVLDLGPTVSVGAIADLETAIATNTADILAGASGSAAASSAVQSNLDAYISSNDAAVALNGSNLTAETAARGVALTALNTTLTSAISQEATDRAAAIAAETTARTAADLTLTTDLATEVTDRTAADTAEASTRAAADAGLSAEIATERARIDAILGSSSVNLDTLQELVAAYTAADSSIVATQAAIQTQLTALQAEVDALTAA